jgi:hypothetical protein
MNRYLPIKINGYDYKIDLCGNTWTDTGLPVSIMHSVSGQTMWFRLHICELVVDYDKPVRILSEYMFLTEKKVTVEFMDKTYRPGDSDFELIKLHEALETETALARLD